MTIKKQGLVNDPIVNDAAEAPPAKADSKPVINFQRKTIKLSGSTSDNKSDISSMNSKSVDSSGDKTGGKDQPPAKKARAKISWP